jgi:hypothetical protein
MRKNLPLPPALKHQHSRLYRVLFRQSFKLSLQIFRPQHRKKASPSHIQ